MLVGPGRAYFTVAYLNEDPTSGDTAGEAVRVSSAPDSTCTADGTIADGEIVDMFPAGPGLSEFECPI